MLCRINFFVLFSISVSGLNQYPLKDLSNRRQYPSSEDKQIISPYNEVIDNITRVNNVLEELIDNYAKLKHMYQSQETLSEYSSDGEIDQVYKMKKQRAEDSKTTTRRPSRLATDMFLSEEHANEDVSDEASDVNSSHQKEHSKEDSEKETTIKTQPNNVMEKERDANVQYLIKNETQLSAKDDTDNNLVSVKPSAGFESNEVPAKNKLTIQKPGSDKKTQRKTKQVKENSKEDTLNTSEMTKESDSSDDNTSIFAVDDKDSNQLEEKVIYPNMIKKAMNPNSKNLSNNQMKAPAAKASNGSVQYRTVKQVIKAEEFSKHKIWDEVVNKPVKLNTENEVVYKQPKIFFRNQNGQKGNKPRPESLEDEKVIIKEQFKTRILRKAYGDACLKVVVKKCYKACKEAEKVTCKKYKCKAAFKTKFLGNAKTGCIKEFTEVGPNSRSGVLQRDQGFRDVTRNGYLAAACLPTSRPAQITRRSLNISLSALGPDLQLNILRDRFEHACQEASAAKCTEACHYAIKQTCSNIECKGSKKSAFDKECRKQCKLSYKSESSKSHEHSGSSSSESSTKSESSSSSESFDVADKVSNETKTNKKEIIPLKQTNKKNDTKKNSEKEKKTDNKKDEEKEAIEVEEKEEKEENNDKEENEDEDKDKEEEEKEEKENKKDKKNKKKHKKRA